MKALAWWWGAIVLLAMDLSAQGGPLSTAGLQASTAVSTDGTVDLTWSTGSRDAASWQLEEAVEGAISPVVLDAGMHRASARSGLANGTYVYRVRPVHADGTVGAWSQPVEVEVRHHALGLAFAFFGVGAFVFVATAWLVVSGHRRTARGED